MASCGFKEKASIENKYPYPADSPSRKQMKTETKKGGKQIHVDNHLPKFKRSILPVTRNRNHTAAGTNVHERSGYLHQTHLRKTK